MELAAALVAHVARAEGIPLLVIKGPVLAAQGLREPRNYADVDIWVPRDSAARLVVLLSARGWHERGANWFIDRVGSHSITLIHDRWPCDIDIHVRFPGFLAPDDVVFESLWRSRTALDLAGTRVMVTDPAGSAAVLALHSLRQMWDRSKAAEFEQLARRLARQPDLVRSLAALSAVVGANETLEPLFRRLGAEPPTGYTATARQLREWHDRRAHDSRTGLWIGYLKSTPMKRWPRELAAVIWPNPSQFLQDHPNSPRTRRALVWGRIRRLAKGVTALKFIARERRLGRRRVRPYDRHSEGIEGTRK
ncbi:nucleotidyltransferase family protein [Herbiconiux sp. YIM B11900]|uniref:nucleotidyltransferase family protein n=1 Tax=Herbiconiux sp. YIM B11900 TaxID=3404131 RepID=UPI003F86B062